MVPSPSPSRSSSPKNLYNPHTCLAWPNYCSCAEHWTWQELLSEKAADSSFLKLTSIPTMVHTPPPPPQPIAVGTQSPFLRLPTEIRLQIYALLLLPRKSSDLHPDLHKKQVSLQDSFDYDTLERGTDRVLKGDVNNPTLIIRTIEGGAYKQLYGPNKPRGSHLRKTYGVNARFRAGHMKTTYHCVNNPRLEDSMGIMCASRQIHTEAAELFYSSYTFDFDTHVEAISPFFSDLTPYARSFVKSIRIVKRGLAYDREYDRAEWSNALRFLSSSSSNINLRRLELGIVAGRPGPNGWDRIATYSAREMQRVKDMDNMRWLQYVLEIKGLQELEVCAIVEHCPPANNSMAMAAFIRFSASVEKGFAEYLRGVMLPP